MNAKTAIFALPVIPVKIQSEATNVTVISPDGSLSRIFASKVQSVTVLITFVAMR